MKFDAFLTIILLLISLMLYSLVISRKYISSLKKLYFTTAFIGIIIYSGISTLYIDLCENYFIHFLIYIVVFSFSFVGACHIRIGRYLINYSDSQIENNKTQTLNTMFDSAVLSDHFLIIMTILSYSFLVIQLVYPVNKLGNLINISISQKELFTNRDYSRSLSLYRVFNYIELGSLGFFYVYIGRLVNKGKIGIAITLILLRVYLTVGLNQYISRTEIVSYILFVSLLIVYKKYRYKQMFKTTLKLFFVLMIAVIVFSPLLYLYQFLRLGLSLPDINFADAFSNLIYSETNYGQYYDTLLELSSDKGTRDWFLWILTLPIPSAIFTFKNDIVLVNQVLSEYVTGYPYGHIYYSVKLPSLFGEALYVFGIVFYWMHAAFIGLFINKLSGFLEKDENLAILNLWFATQSLLLGRGGSSSLIPNAVNILFFYSIEICIINLIRKYKCVRMHKGGFLNG